MELYKKINQIIEEKSITKKEFICRFISLEPKLKRTGEIPLEASIYSYLNGKRELKVELIPYIAEALDVTEQELFNNNEQTRLEYLKYILKSPSQNELAYITECLNKHHSDDEKIKELLSLLPYASKPLILSFIEKLKLMKELTI